jgi:phytoene/squalene synthetase
LDIGRVYLPAEDRWRFGYADADLERRRFTGAFAALMRFEVERTRDLFYRGMPVVDHVLPELRLDVDLFVRGGLAILRKIERINYNVWLRRPVLSHWGKAGLVAQALWHKWVR